MLLSSPVCIFVLCILLYLKQCTSGGVGQEGNEEGERGGPLFQTGRVEEAWECLTLSTKIIYAYWREEVEAMSFYCAPL